ncbi:MAG TPA: L-threonine 3-dehydrogenase [Candidatus Limnocylindrales bacterium]|jgi:threonine 3-dehydrogenase
MTQGAALAAVEPAALPRTMRALVKATAAPGAELREVPLPEPSSGEVLVKVLAASVCGTDVHIERWDAWAQEHVRPPMIFGHEMAGIVVAHGPGTGRVGLGELVAAETHLVDWTCYQCRTGRAHVCQHLRILGVHAPGSFAQYAVIPETNAWVSEGLTPEVAALQEPMGNAVHAAFVEEIAGQSVVVTGCGPIGLMAVAIARLAGARHVFATDLMPERLEIARQMGAHEVIDARDDVAARLRALTDGDGVDVVLEMSGAEAALHQGLAALTNGGRISLLGTHAMPATMDLSEEVIFKGIRVYGITGRRMFETWYRTTALLEEGLDLAPIITHRLPLADYRQAFDLVAAGHAGKVVLLPQEG